MRIKQYFFPLIIFLLVSCSSHASNYDRGNAFLNIGQYEQAITEYTRAIELDPEYAEAYYRRGLVYKQLWKCSDANSDFLEAYTISGDIIYKDTCP